MKLFLKIFLVVVIVLALVIGGFGFYMTRGLETGADLAIGNVDLNKLDDGVYNGTYNSGRFSNTVAVTVKDHKITGIELVKNVTFNKPEVTKELFDNVIEKQDVAVDTVSSATTTSKAYLKAIENALNGTKQ
ncbi:MAG TPA: FMN-binding protein [Clostridia bacterium]|nr:FMN-binding protein [Clostridia bacterium]